MAERDRGRRQPPGCGGRACAQRPRLPRGRPRSTLRRWRRARPGSGWDGVESAPLSATRTPDPPNRRGSRHARSRSRSKSSASTDALWVMPVSTPRRTTDPDGDPPSTMSTASLRSVTGRPRAASQPGGLPGVLPPSGVRRLILGRASHLDAVSGYPCRTWLPSNAGCPTTGTPAVRPARSSRTRASPPQPSAAHGG